MRVAAWITVIAIACCLPSLAQDSTASPQTAAPAGNTAAGQQKNAASAAKDTSGTTGDQITKPPAAKGSTLIGCLAGPDADGKYTLRNMDHRSGVEVLGASDLKSDSGSKVKLTGQWQGPNHAALQQGKTAEMPRFQSTDIEVISPTCHAPTDTTPVSKNKSQKPTTYNAPSSDDSPKQ